MGIRIFGIAGSSNAAEDFRLAASGIFVPASALNNRGGVLSTPVLTGTGSFTATVGPFAALVDGTSNSLQGSYWAAVDTATTVTIGAASGSARIDLIGLQIQDNAYDGSGFQRGQLTVTAGTPGSGVPPTTPANTLALWTVPVGAGASSVTFSSAIAVFPYTAATGGIIPVRGATDQPAVADAVVYRHRMDVAAGGTSPTEWSTDGTTWNPVYAGWSAWTAMPSLDSRFVVAAYNLPRYRTGPGGMVQVTGALNYTGSTGAITSVTLHTIPNTARSQSFPAMVESGPTPVINPSMVNVYLTSMIFVTPNINNGTTLYIDGISWPTN